MDCEDFLGRFVLPLVAGGEMHVAGPIDGPAFVKLAQGLPHASVPLVAIDEARTRVLGTLVARPPALVFDEDELSLAAALHNLLYLAHPDAEGWAVSDSKRAKIVRSAQSFAAQPRTTHRTQVLARHGLLYNLLAIGRTDVKVSWWSGSSTYVGQKVPSRLTRWQDVRRVRQEESRVGFRELFQGADVDAVIATLLRRSPLTQLLSAGQGGPHLHWDDVVFLLRDAELTRALAYAITTGATAEAQARAPAYLAASLEQMLERTPEPADLRAVVAFLVYLNCLLALREVDLRQDSPLLAATLGTSKRARGIATFFALPAAAALVDTHLAEPPGLTEDEPLQRRFAAHRRQAAKLLGDSVIESLAERLRRRLGGDDGSTLG